MIENVISDAIRTSVNVTLYGVMVILGARVIPFSFRSAAIISRRMTFFILVPDVELDEGGWYLDVVVVGRGDDLRWLGEKAMSSGDAYRPVDGAIWVTNSTILRAALRSGSRSGL